MRRSDALPLVEDFEWVRESFHEFPEAIRPFCEFLYKKGWNGKTGSFEAELAIDLDALNKKVMHENGCSPVDALIGYKKNKALLVYISLLSDARPSVFKGLNDCIELSRKIVKTIDCGISVHETTVVLLKDKYYHFFSNLLIRNNPCELYSLDPLTVGDFYERVFRSGFGY